MNQLNCSLPYMPPVKDRHMCTTAEESRATHLAAYSIMQYKTLDAICGCIKSCEEHVTTYQFESVQYTRQGIVQLYYPTSIVQISKEDLAYSTVQLISDVGGNLGLFLGFCLLSVVDSLQLAVDLIYEKLEARKKERKTAHIPTAGYTTTPVMPMMATQHHGPAVPTINPGTGDQGRTSLAN